MAVLASFARIYVSDLDVALDALAVAGMSEVRLRFGHDAGLCLALVGNVLVLAGTDEALAPFRATDLTVIVDDLDTTFDSARAAGASIVRGPAAQAVGRNATVSFPSGPVIEYVEWDEPTRAAAGM